MEAVHDSLGHGSCLVHLISLLSEAVHRSRRRLSCVVVGAEDLLADGLERVARVGVHIVGPVREEYSGRGRVGDGEPVRLGAGDAVDGRVEPLHPPQHVVEGPVLHHYHHHVFYWALGGAAAGDDEEKEDCGGDGGGDNRHWVGVERERGERERESWCCACLEYIDINMTLLYMW